ncbi:acetyl-CoA carboxylase biotin carboxylase subunit [Methylovirgula sp. 4M-Z18]|uniref:acetyl-CoA carboxylase biotin carboxylase subunit n=1 Tax=Methylovirgula sp. 4M-Z18 TaxID=2293567 RepID=UPI000E2F6573|nr:acetyl/propionyl/methylcrotonyl-CoA carboxylase subunit alpha [Methylovirgula sp. 4M-Z18]RFB79908.1 acetyl/propionyl/methylcrotonyl-CoA carboxylase subunit alpha [Methylovirgula sp. 4M-Z18]
MATSLRSVLIANRGEIACRIMRTAKKLGMHTIAVYSEADAHAQHVKQADEAYLIGPAPARESYLVADKIIAVAKQAKADCIHPGYGFLSENVDFAQACADAGIVFVGPPPSAIRAMGLKDGAKALMQKAGVPVVPGYHGAEQDAHFLAAQAEAISYPVLIKAVAGGGGKGMRRVDAAADFAAALEGAQREAQSAFGNSHVLIEKYILAPRHIEMQVFGDAHGNAIHLFERDCSLQRRHQKVIEEAPAPGMTPEVRAAMGKAAVDAARAVGYQGAGTIEFIVDGSKGLRADGFYFMEMNTRLQVEHPVTEAITGLDLVALQFRVAAGEPLPVKQEDIRCTGHAFEARLYAEDPENGFLPQAGKLWSLHFPTAPGLRVDTGVAMGDEVTPFYDPMIAKLITHGATRQEALTRLAQALKKTTVAGPKCNVRFLRALCEAPAFRDEQFDTGFIDRNLTELGAVTREINAASVARGAVFAMKQKVHDLHKKSPFGHDPWNVSDGFALTGPRRSSLAVLVEGKRVDAVLTGSLEGAGQSVTIPSLHYDHVTYLGLHKAQPDMIASDCHVIGIPGGGTVFVLDDGQQTTVVPFDPLGVDYEHEGEGDGTVTSPMHGKLVALFVKPGDKVEKGQRVAIVEAMKMEHTLVAPSAGVVSDVAAAEGQQVAQDARLITIHTEEAS